MEEKTYIGDLVLLRGGSELDKKTLGSVILRCISSDEPDVISYLDYFPTENFDVSKLKEAQNDCQVRCANKMKNEFAKIVVSIINESEIEPYQNIADRYNYRVYSVIVDEIKKDLNV